MNAARPWRTMRRYSDVAYVVDAHGQMLFPCPGELAASIVLIVNRESSPMRSLEQLLLPLIRSVMPVDPDSAEDATEVYDSNDLGERATYDLLDSDNTCIDPGGHVFRRRLDGERCIHCDERFES